MLWDDEFDRKPWGEVMDHGLERSIESAVALAEKSDYHRERLQYAVGSRGLNPQNWPQMPTMGKADVRASQAKLGSGPLSGSLQVVEDKELIQVIGSSGTTGAPTFFGITEKDAENWAGSIANMYWTAGIRPDSVVALTTGMPLVAGGMPYADAIRRTGATLVWIGGQTTERMAHLMKALRPDVLVGTASFVPHFARRCEEILGVPASELSVRTIIAGGEPGMSSPAARRRALEAWGADRLSEVMGLGDIMPGLWGECEAGDGMHFTGGRNAFAELVDPETGEARPWENGATGEVIYTNFSKEANPMIRYRSRDHIKVVGTECTCGRTAPRIRCIGRTDDMVIYKAMNLFPSELKAFILEQFTGRVSGNIQVVKTSADQVRFDSNIPLRVELGPAGAEPALAEAIEEAVRQSFRVRVSVEFLEHGSVQIGLHKNALTVVQGEEK